MNNQNPPRSEHNASMSERDKQKTVSNPSPGSSDPGNENLPKRREAPHKRGSH